MAAGILIIKKGIANSVFLRNNVYPLCFFSSPNYYKGYHASVEHKRNPDYDKGFNDDRTIDDAGDRILEMTKKTKRSMEESMAKTARKIDESKKKSEKTSELVHETIDEVKKTREKMKNIWGNAKEKTNKIKENVVGKLWDNNDDINNIEDHTGRKKKENDKKY
ncbi:hypothetical protein P3S68_003150 [Capsicum galapagoense]